MSQNYVLGFMKNESETLLLQRRGKQDAWQGRWNGCAGTLKADEKPLDGMVRKFEEEMGARTDPGEWQLRGTLSTPNGIIFVFAALGNIYRAKQTEDESPLYYDANANWLREPVVPSLRYILPLVFNFDVVSFNLEIK